MPRLWRAGTEGEDISIHGVCGESSCVDRAFYKNPVYKGGRCRPRLRCTWAGCPWGIPVKINTRQWLLRWGFFLQERIRLPCQFDCTGGNRGGNKQWSEHTTMAFLCLLTGALEEDQSGGWQANGSFSVSPEWLPSWSTPHVHLGKTQAIPILGTEWEKFKGRVLFVK